MAPYMCLMYYHSWSLLKNIETSRHYEFDKVAVPLENVELSLEQDNHTSLGQKFERTSFEVKLNKDDWKENIIILLPNYGCDALESKTRKKAESSLENDLISGVDLVKTGKLMLQLKSHENTNLARIIAKQTKSTFLIQVPLKSPCGNKSRNLEDDEQDTWLWWHNFRCLNNYRKNLKVVLKLQADDIPTDENISRWLSEPLEAIIVPSSLFTPDKWNNAQLTPAWCQAMTYFMLAHVNVIKNCTGEYFAKRDELIQAFHTVHNGVNQSLYFAFEMDKRKLKLYFDAIVEALADSPPQAFTDVLVITLLGAGSGLLIRCILTAAERTSRRVRIYIIEKNGNAVTAMKHYINKYISHNDIYIFCEDMREFTPPEKADILVSDLFGSFGGNELSPECLDCAGNFIKPNGVFIPRSSSSYIHPIMAPTYRDEILKFIQGPVNNNIDFESTYTFRMRNAYHISPPQMLFTFEYPNEGLNSDNTRYRVLQFRAVANCVMNGLAGTFDAKLYNDHQLSTHFGGWTPVLKSCFPIFFPFLEPIDIKKDDEIEIHFWRCVDSHKVWYEWCCVSPRRTHIHNFGGRSGPIYSN